MFVFFRILAQCPKTRKLSADKHRRLCSVKPKSPDQCRTNADCVTQNQGRLCCTGKCGRKYCYSPSTHASTTTTALPGKK